jgi:anti-sigma regulatory factor (Ser/Thr protein kinase)
MSGGTGPRVRDEIRARLVADPVSVPAARRLVRDALIAWGVDQLVEDACLCVSELTSNAALHSASPYFDIVLDDQPGSVRICVDDQGPVPAAAVVQRDRSPVEELDDDLSALEALTSTGRGLMIVSAIASDWGVEETSAGKRVWAQLTYDPGATGAEPVPRPSVSATAPDPASLPAGWHVVRLAGCPVQLSLRQDRHLDELIRELQLVDGSDADPPRELAKVISDLLQQQASARHMGRLTAQRAVAAGLQHVDVDMTVPGQAAEAVQELNRAVRAADALCRRQQLLTLASSPEVVALREWMSQEIAAQICDGAPPTTYEDWLARSGTVPSPPPAGAGPVSA